MPRFNIVTQDTANADQAPLLDAVKSGLGMVPNFLGILAHSPDALQSFLGLHNIAGNGALDPAIRERIALVVAQDNACEYCLSAHSAMGRKAGLDADEIAAARQATSADVRAEAAVQFAQALNVNRGDITDAELAEVRAAGFSDAEIVEIITHVGMNFLTNVIGKASQVDIDFPKVDLHLNQAAA